jgi:hypothetical protein
VQVQKVLAGLRRDARESTSLTKFGTVPETNLVVSGRSKGERELAGLRLTPEFQLPDYPILAIANLFSVPRRGPVTKKFSQPRPHRKIDAIFASQQCNESSLSAAAS